MLPHRLREEERRSDPVKELRPQAVQHSKINNGEKPFIAYAAEFNRFRLDRSLDCQEYGIAVYYQPCSRLSNLRSLPGYGPTIDQKKSEVSLPRGWLKTRKLAMSLRDLEAFAKCGGLDQAKASVVASG